MKKTKKEPSKAFAKIGSPYSLRINRLKMLGCSLVFGCIGLWLLLPTLAYTLNDGFIHPGVVYTQAEINAWSASSSEYTRLANSSAASLGKTPWVYGTQINSGGNAGCSNCDLNNGFKDQSGYAKIQAVLWAADNNQARKNMVIAYLNEYRPVTSFENDSVQQYRLVAGWACTNLAQAAEIIDYQDTEFKSFLKNVCYPVMDWLAGPNWHASFADSKLAIAAYVGDKALWADAKAYFNERIKQSIYYSAYDGNKAFPMHTEDNGSASRLHSGSGITSIAATQQQWGRDWAPDGISQVNSDLTFNTKYGAPVDGMNAERTRDLSHVNMGLGAWMHAMRTLKAQGESNTTDYKQAYNRLLAAYNYQAGNVYTYATTGNFAAPVPYKGDGGGARFQSYYGAKVLFGGASPQSVLNMLSRSEVTTSAPAGANHMIAEAFADSYVAPPPPTPTPSPPPTPSPTPTPVPTSSPTPTSTPTPSPTPTPVPTSSPSPGTATLPPPGNTPTPISPEEPAVTPNTPIPAATARQIEVIVDRRKVAASSDGSVPVIDTSTLNNGKHTITVNAVDASGKSHSLTQDISVNNRLNPFESFRNTILKPWAGKSGRLLNIMLGIGTLGIAMFGFGIWKYLLFLRVMRSF